MASLRSELLLPRALEMEHLDNPIHKSSVQVGMDGDKVVSCHHYAIQRVKIGDEVHYGAMGADLAVHPDYRKLGLFKKMFDLQVSALKKFGIYYYGGVSYNPIVQSFFKEKNIPFPHQVVKYIRIVDIEKHARTVNIDHKLIKKYGYDLIKSYQKISDALSSSDSKKTGLDVSEIDHFGDDIDVFWDEVKDRYSFIKERRREYLNWRFCDQRGGRYVIKKAEDEGKTLGFIVLRINRDRIEYPVGIVADIVARSERPEVNDLLIADAVDYFDEHGVNAAYSLAIKNNPIAKSLRKHGFINSRTVLSFTLFPLTEPSQLQSIVAKPAGKYHFLYGDFDEV